MITIRGKCPGAPALALLAVAALLAPASALGHSDAPAGCTQVQEAEQWPNPDIMVRAGGFIPYLKGQAVCCEAREMTLNETLSYLKKLPKSAWPCGRILWVGESGLISGVRDVPLMDANFDRLMKALKKMGLKTVLIPSA